MITDAEKAKIPVMSVIGDKEVELIAPIFGRGHRVS